VLACFCSELKHTELNYEEPNDGGWQGFSQSDDFQSPEVKPHKHQQMSFGSKGHMRNVEFDKLVRKRRLALQRNGNGKGNSSTTVVKTIKPYKPPRIFFASRTHSQLQQVSEARLCLV
jgi:hypothetical protein